MRDIKPLLLILLSIGLVGTWTYHLYDKTIYSQRRTEVFVRDSAAVADAIRDSLQKIYSSTITDLDSRLVTAGDSLSSSQARADSLQRRLEKRLAEINRLKSEINAILNKGNASTGDMALARKKITELQEQVSQLETQQGSMESEKKVLAQTLADLTQNAGKLEQNIRRLNDENANLQEKIALASVYVASDVGLTAVNVKGSRESETNQSKKADKLVVSLVLQNHLQDYTNSEIAIVIIQPDRQTLQNPNWDSGSMDTQAGRKNYTRLVRFDYSKGERKPLTFSLDVDEFQKGTYQLEIWQKGILLGKAAVSLK